MPLVRLQKFLADAGVASRRAAETIIEEGRVTVNGTRVSVLGTRVDPANDRITVDGQPLREKKKLYIVLNKPRGFVSTRRDEAKRRVVGDLLPREWSNLYPVGRLDYDTEGLLLMTNDGQFALQLTHPRYGVTKTYQAAVEGRVTPAHLARMTAGVIDRGELLKADKARIVLANNSNSLVELLLSEGKNREVRRLFEAQGLRLTRLLRTKIGPVRLGELPTGKWRALTEPEIKSLLARL